jgi:hypothetical protein
LAKASRRRHGQESLGSEYWLSGWPKLVAQWHPTRNGALRPEDVTFGSALRVWWQCPIGRDHEWTAKPNNRTSGDTGCPFCAGRKVSCTNCLAAVRPDLATQWHPTRNGDRTPTNTLAGSTCPAWWKCPAANDHEWHVSPHSRAYGEGECPFCIGRRPSSTNSLSLAHPAVAAEWHGSRNGALSPSDVPERSARLVWWRCSRDGTHEWRASVCNRSVRRSGCPFCAGRRASPARCLASEHPAVAIEWHPTRNLPLAPTAVAPRASRAVWWLCARGHEWQAAIRNRTKRRAGCPVCRLQRNPT